MTRTTVVGEKGFSMGKLIDVDALVEAIHGTAWAGKDILDEAWTWGLTKAATLAVEQPEAVVRCRDCKHSDMERFDNGEVLFYCNMNLDELGMQRVVEKDHYCGFGERKEP